MRVGVVRQFQASGLNELNVLLKSMQTCRRLLFLLSLQGPFILPPCKARLDDVSRPAT